MLYISMVIIVIHVSLDFSHSDTHTHSFTHTHGHTFMHTLPQTRNTLCKKIPNQPPTMRDTSIKLNLHTKRYCLSHFKWNLLIHLLLSIALPIAAFLSFCLSLCFPSLLSQFVLLSPSPFAFSTFSHSPPPSYSPGFPHISHLLFLSSKQSGVSDL